MGNRKFYSFKKHLKESLYNEDFLKVWKKTEPEYVLAREIIKMRSEKNISQNELAKKAKTTQAIISKIEKMKENPSLSTIKRIARALGYEVDITFRKYPTTT